MRFSTYPTKKIGELTLLACNTASPSLPNIIRFNQIIATILVLSEYNLHVRFRSPWFANTVTRIVTTTTDNATTVAWTCQRVRRKELASSPLGSQGSLGQRKKRWCIPRTVAVKARKTKTEGFSSGDKVDERRPLGHDISLLNMDRGTLPMNTDFCG